MLKDRASFPAGGFPFKQAETGWNAPAGITFNQVVAKIVEHRLANPRFGLSTNKEIVADQLDTYTCHRLRFNPQWCTDEKKTTTPVKSFLPRLARWRTSFAHTVASLKAVPSGAKIIKEWLGEGGVPVSSELANYRSDVCQHCPENQPLNATDKLTQKLAESVKEYVELKNNLKLTVTGENALHVCRVCTCHLPLKIHVPIKHVVAHTYRGIIGKFPNNCWIVNERRRLLFVLPFSIDDFFAAEKLLLWIEELGGCKENPALLVADCRLDATRVEHLEQIAKRIFSVVEVIATPKPLPDEKWPAGANYMLKTSAEHINAHYLCAWWWNEPDCIPLKEGWFTALENAYSKQQKEFMGSIVDGAPPMPEKHLSGNAVYPAKAIELLEHYLPTTKQEMDERPGVPQAWDVLSAARILPLATNSELVHDFWGKDKEPPTFVEPDAEDKPPNAMTLADIPETAVVFHRNKDGTLIDLLRLNDFRLKKKYSPQRKENLGPLLGPLAPPRL